MIKLSASISKKLPVPDVEFSSRSCSAAIEAELPSGTKSEEVLARLKQLYGLLELAVDEQLSSPRQIPRQDRDAQPDTSNGSGAGRRATGAQIKAIRAIAHDRGLSDGRLHGLMQTEFDAGHVEELSVREASSLITILKHDGKARR